MAALPAIMKTTAARLSALYLVLFAITAASIVFYMTSLSVRMLTAQTHETINEEVQELGRAYRRGGLPLLVRFIELRARQPGANLYLMADPNGRILSGNVESLAPGVLDQSGWTERPFAYHRYGEKEVARRSPGMTADDISHTAVAEVFRLPNSMIVLVGRDLGEPEQFRAVVRRALVVAFSILGVGALLIWFFVGRRALRHIDRVSDASRRIMGGDLSGRLPVSGVGDEFDRLSGNLNAMLDRIAALNEGLRHVSDNIAHDLKTPLTRLRNRAESALAGKPETADYRAALERTIAESDQLIRTFNAILMISRLESGYSAEATTRVDLTRTVADVVELYEPAAEEVGVTLEAVEGPNASVGGNRELIGQALSNIVDNAIKYSAGSSDEPRVTVRIEETPRDVALVVDDNGPGIPETERRRVTERFVRLETSRSQPGSGLGLSLARAVMTYHGGRVEVSGRDPGLSVAMIFPAGKDG